MKILRAAAAVAVAAAGFAISVPARAEPAFAVRTGYRCSQCHVNRTGGGMRTPFGSLYGQTLLPERLLRWRDGANLLPANPDARLAYGGDARFQYGTVWPDAAGSRASFDVTEANLYGEVRLFPATMSLYLDAQVGPGGASARELFALFSMRKGRSYVKVGKFLPPFGWRLPDDAAFIRQFTGFSYSNPDIGVEIGAEPGKWSISLAAVNGAGGGGDDNRSKQLSLLVVRRIRSARFGVSGATNKSGGIDTTHAGLLGGINIGRVALLAEADRVGTSVDGESFARWMALLEANVLLTRGLNLKIAHDWIDPDRDVVTDARVRDSIGLEYIPYPFIQLRTFLRRRDGPPQVADSRETQVDLELHIYF